jgi:hypothetical protein
MRVSARRGILRFVMNLKILTTLLILGALTFAVACGSGSDDDGDDNGNQEPTTAADQTGEPAGNGDDLQTPTVSVSSPEIAVGAEGEVTVSIGNAVTPGVGAWTVDVTYDADVVSIVSCESLQGTNVCNDAFTGDTVRIVGAIAVGLEGTNVIGRLVFSCNVAGESPLSIHVETLADGTIGAPRDLTPVIEEGAITCA